jgi:hypothetical protein
MKEIICDKDYVGDFYDKRIFSDYKILGKGKKNAILHR